MDKTILNYKNYKVIKTVNGNLEVWDYTFRTPTTWLCYRFEESEYTKEKAKSIIDECIINNRIARKERANG